MAIIVNEPLVLAQSQSVRFDSLSIVRTNSGMRAVISFSVLDENNNVVSQKRKEYNGADFNTFWSNFNSGIFLYEELNLGVTVPGSVESEFQN